MVTMQFSTQIRGIAMLNVDCIPDKWGGVAVQHAVEKTFLVAQPVQPVALTSQVACYQSTINKRRP